MRFELTITDSAAADLLGITEYIAHDNVQAALKFHDKVINIFQSLETTPFIGSQIRIKRLKLLGYRKLVIDSYIAYYIVDTDKKQVSIIRILHGAMKQEKHL